MVRKDGVILRATFLRLAILGATAPLVLGTHTAPKCVRWGDSRTFGRLGSYSFTHLSRPC
jgi:hypothetical protein